MSAKQKDVGSSPAHDQYIYCAGVFRLGDTFFRKFLKCLQRVPPSFLYFFAKVWMFKPPKGLLLHFSTLCDLPETKKIRKKISKKSFNKIRNFFDFFFTRVL